AVFVDAGGAAGLGKPEPTDEIPGWLLARLVLEGFTVVGDPASAAYTLTITRRDGMYVLTATGDAGSSPEGSIPAVPRPTLMLELWHRADAALDAVDAREVPSSPEARQTVRLALERAAAGPDARALTSALINEALARGLAIAPTGAHPGICVLASGTQAKISRPGTEPCDATKFVVRAPSQSTVDLARVILEDAVAEPVASAAPEDKAGDADADVVKVVSKNPQDDSPRWSTWAGVSALGRATETSLTSPIADARASVGASARVAPGWSVGAHAHFSASRGSRDDVSVTEVALLAGPERVLPLLPTLEAQGGAYVGMWRHGWRVFEDTGARWAPAGYASGRVVWWVLPGFGVGAGLDVGARRGVTHELSSGGEELWRRQAVFAGAGGFVMFRPQ
ncbi:MAG: hypothetical protein AAGI01_14510, partial [Myxococcota bacterium]